MRNILEKETPNFLLPVYPSGEPLILSGTVLLRITSPFSFESLAAPDESEAVGERLKL
ncbi:hypothetical protein ACJIZ3_020613 [Penstemon smallii]|uniref:Uncharacterized protein n=1 Tax=Penstemon smallii TaxID=265156 RepID=A0ABD3SJ36_9LAMI